ncbi:MAG: type II toxin-antitoxin system VapC family toxin [Candidatus Dadabacteria bacterium]|nr:type II toxin-antitoxin system VapC family toxin [Candidatus Dadabacteria bacterium]MYA48150.1 type II toxin-antitoxin system VapC family toxin [Candidatus Dadabacteria bacterium]MYF48509.1 type II toxin-antitoxin system VapC family toxin [Candidatus Dadabacteria bacterium]MYG83582.1 type II toxin-antitoxin system VapC family toxin [Candidatus Dadabacteria bacterium]MYK49662.1 type II toxin-antitoxin system VapC family toxin [Candidatus Dadabacteria bacterium]
MRGPVCVTQLLLLRKGSPIGFADAMIASHALIINATLVTNNQKHFSQVEGLQLENWFSV